MRPGKSDANRCATFESGLKTCATRCRQEIPGFVALQRKYRDKGLVIIGVSLDQRGPSVVKPFIGRFGVNYPVVMGNEQIVSDYGGIEAIPTTFIIDRQGSVITIHKGFTDNANFEAEIRSLL
jgi:peroxiredoxin